MPFSARSAAAWLRKWADVGISAALVDAGLAVLEKDKSESKSRAPKKEGRLAATIRVVKPSSKSKDAKAGLLVFRLGAGSRSADRRKRVSYARVLQTGKVFVSPGVEAPKTKEHTIEARSGDYELRQMGLMGGPPGSSRFRTTGVMRFKKGGDTVYARRVKHPGSKFRGRWYLRLSEGRFAMGLDKGIQASADRAAAQSREYEGVGGS